MPGIADLSSIPSKNELGLRGRRLMAKHKITGWAVGVAVYLLLLQLLPEVRCADGWASPSIGRPGACSHHGGVSGNGVYAILILGASVVCGVFVARQFVPQGRILEPWNLQPESKEAELIRSAIEGHRQIQFTYRKPTAKVSELRTIVPQTFKNVSRKRGRGSTHCVVGFCTLRKEQRTFAVARMSNIRVL